MIRTEEDFDRLLMSMEQVHLLADERFMDVQSRLDHAEELTQLMREVFLQRTSSEWMTLFKQEDLPVALVAQFQDLPTDPQVLANNMVSPPLQDLGMTHVIRDPINVDGLDRVGARPAPDIGQHNDEVLTELGYSVEDIVQLRADGVI